jgi:hypothetical protein
MEWVFYFLLLTSCSVPDIYVYQCTLCVSLICSLSLLILYSYMWYLSTVFTCVSFFSFLIMPRVLFIIPYVSQVLSMWFGYPELLLLFINARTCFSYLVWNFRPVFHTYFSGKSVHFIWWLYTAYRNINTIAITNYTSTTQHNTAT